MIGILDNFHLALPEVTVLVTACLVLLGDLFLKKMYPNIAMVTAYLGLAIAALLAYFFIPEENTILFNGLLISDSASQLMNLFICVCVFLSFFYAKAYNLTYRIASGEFYLLGLLSTLGMMSLAASHSLLTIYLGLELVSLPLYAMTALARSSGDSAEAALKYFVMGAIASAMLLYGISLIYGATGQLDLAQISQAIATDFVHAKLLLAIGLVFILAGIGFKLALIPFHMWAPDVYEGAPTSVALFISCAPKIAAVGMALRLLAYGLLHFKVQWLNIAICMAILSTGVGSVVAIAQTNIKRLLAYSTVAHMGYMLFGIIAGTSAGFSYSVYYVLVYALMSVAAFGLITMLSSSGVEISQIGDFKGLNKRNPWLAFLMLILMFSMAGVPPTAGFFAKLLVLKALVDAQLTWLAVLGLIFAVIGGFYYIRIVKVMYFEEPNDPSAWTITTAEQLMFSANAILLIALGIWPSMLINVCASTFSG